MHKILPYKTNQFLFVLLKISLVVGAFYFIYSKLTKNNQLDLRDFNAFLTKSKVLTLKNMFFLIILSSFNWFVEILKWRDLVSVFKKISIKMSLQQSLGSLTASLLTPNRIGEYGAKAIFYTSEYRKKVVLLNLLGNTTQMLITTIFGLIGWYFFIMTYPMGINYNKMAPFVIVLLIIFSLIFIGWKKKEVTIKGFSIEKIVCFFKNIPIKHYIYCTIFSILRYLTFSFQFYFLLHLFGVEIAYINAMIAITTMYLLASLIPSIFIFDVIVKGSVAVYLFLLVGVDELIILSIITCMWLLNFVFPSILGSVFVLKFKFPKVVSS